MRFTEIENNNIGGASRRETNGTRERKGVPHKTLPRNPPSRYFARQSVGRLMFLSIGLWLLRSIEEIQR